MPSLAVMALLPEALAAQFGETPGVGPHATALYVQVADAAGAAEVIAKRLRGMTSFEVELEHLEIRGEAQAVGVKSVGLGRVRAEAFRALEEAGVAYTLTHGGEFWPHASLPPGFEGPPPTGSGFVSTVAVAVEGEETTLVELGAISERLSRGRAPVQYDAATPVGLYVPARPWRIFGVGPIHCIFSGKLRRQVVEQDLHDLAEYFRSSSSSSTVPIDWDHGEDSSLGQVLDLYVDDEDDGRGPGLYAVVGLTEAGRRQVQAHGGETERPHLWTSPTIYWGEMHSKTTGARISGAGMLRLALTPEPASDTRTIEPARLNVHETGGDAMEVEMDPENETEVEEMTLEEALAELMERDKKIAELEAKLAELEAEAPDVAEVMEASSRKDREIVQMRKQVEAYNVRVESMERDLANERANKAVDELMWAGKLRGDERAAALKAYHARGEVPEFWAMFSARPAGEVVPVGERRTHGADAATVDDAQLAQQLRAEIDKYAVEKGCSQAEAMAAIRKAKPDAWKRAITAVAS